MCHFDESAEPRAPLPAPPPLPPSKPPFRDSIIVYIITSALLLVLGTTLQTINVLGGLLITELVLVIGPSVFYVWRWGYPFKVSFHLAPTDITSIVLSVLGVLTFFVLVGGIAQLQELILPRSESYQELWEQMLRQFHALPFPVTWLVVAVLPGLCEELFFRGFMLWGFRTHFADRTAIIWVGILFGIFHFDPYRFVPVTLLGILFGYLVVQTGSLIPAIIAHVTNNSIAIGLSYVALKFLDEADFPTQESISWQQILAFLPVMAMAGAGFWIVMRLLYKHSTSREEDMKKA